MTMVSRFSNIHADIGGHCHIRNYIEFKPKEIIIFRLISNGVITGGYLLIQTSLAHSLSDTTS
jgi:hypothetical protein